MPMFGFDEQYAYYGVTPVDNQFILEYLPNATGDAVRVYLYGLMQCYHPQQAMTLAKMARELNLEEEAVLSAYRYWERRGLVRRISDAPAYKYVNIKQLTMMGDVATIDPEYENFSSEISALFGYDREIHGNERACIFEWVDQMHLPMDVVLYLIKFMIKWRGKKVGIETIQRRAALLASEEVKTVEDAELVLNRDKAVWDGARTVIKRLESMGRYPSEDELGMYRTWHVDWGFSQEDILAACAETINGKPNFGYLNGILSRLRAQQKTTGVEAALREEKDAAAPLKALLKVMKLQNVTINEGTQAVYADMRALYPDNIILMAGKECAKRGADFEGVMTTLKNWKRNGLESSEDVTRYMKQVDDMNDFLLMLYEVLGVSVKPNAAERRLAMKWLETYGYDMGFVTQCAAWAIGKEKPMLYLDAVLSNFHEKGISTMEAAMQERENHQQSLAKQPAQAAPVRGPKVVEQQQYTQREYAHTEDAMDAMMRKWQEESGNA